MCCRVYSTRDKEEGGSQSISMNAKNFDVKVEEEQEKQTARNHKAGAECIQCDE